MGNKSPKESQKPQSKKQKKSKTMNNYDNETLFLIPGKTPLQKHENITEILRIIQEIAYPKRGTEEENKTLQDFADEIIRLKIVEQ